MHVKNKLRKKAHHVKSWHEVGKGVKCVRKKRRNRVQKLEAKKTSRLFAFGTYSIYTQIQEQPGEGEEVNSSLSLSRYGGKDVEKYEEVCGIFGDQSMKIERSISRVRLDAERKRGSGRKREAQRGK